MTPYFDDGQCRIYHGDCREILPALGESFDLLLTDPPWGTGQSYAPHAGGRPVGAKRWRPVAHIPVANDDRPFDPRPDLALAQSAILWGANHYAERLPSSPFWLAWDRKCGRAPETNITDCELAWVKGHRFRTVRLFRHMWAGLQRDSEVGLRVMHPTQKPVALMSWCLSFFPDASSVVDPYMGSGPVARACKDAGKRYVGIEIDERYCEIAAKRLAQQAMQFGEAAP